MCTSQNIKDLVRVIKVNKTLQYRQYRVPTVCVYVHIYPCSLKINIINTNHVYTHVYMCVHACAEILRAITVQTYFN